MKGQLEQIKQNALAALDAADSIAQLEELRVKLLGKKGELTAVLKQMGKLSAEERPVMGQLANAVRAEIEEKLEQQKATLSAAALEAQLAADALPNNPSAALEAVERFSARWERLEGMWQLFAIHNDLDNVTLSMLEAQNALQISNIQDAATACAKLLLSLEEIHQKEVPTPGNIF